MAGTESFLIPVKMRHVTTSRPPLSRIKYTNNDTNYSVSRKIRYFDYRSVFLMRITIHCAIKLSYNLIFVRENQRERNVQPLLSNTVFGRNKTELFYVAYVPGNTESILDIGSNCSDPKRLSPVCKY